MVNMAGVSWAIVGSNPIIPTNKINMCLNIQPGTKKQTAEKDLYTFKVIYSGCIV